MRTRIYKLFAVSTASVNAAAQLIVQRNSIITSILWVVKVNSLTYPATLEWEVSLASTGQTGTNDTIGPLSGFAVCAIQTTSGVLALPGGFLHGGLAIPANQGDRLYLHSTLGGAGMNANVNAYVAAAE